MKRLPWAFLAVLATFSAASGLGVGCGSDNADITDNDGGDANAFDANGNNTTPDDGGSFIDALIDAQRDPDAAACVNVSAACTSSVQCCSANCNATTGVCDNPVGGGGGGGGGGGACKLPGTACQVGTECCTLSCLGGTCSNLQCVADKQACGSSAECCGGNCGPDGKGGGICVPLNGGGPKTDGNPCTQGSQCASTLCRNGVCAPSSFCSQNGDVCAIGTDCCGGICTKAAGATLGTCSTVAGGGGVGNCDVAGTVCSQTTPPAVCGGSCCSRSCAPFGPTGVNVCQLESGCKVTGDICTKDDDCCGAPGAPGSVKNGTGPSAEVHCSKGAGQTVGRCDNPGVCRPAGDTCKLAITSCNAPDDCCAGNDQQHPLNCQQDALGIPRCKAANDFDCTANPKPPAGTPCASSADCCGNACVPNPAGGQPAFICAGAVCVPAGSACSSSSECCAGVVCAIPPGQSSGFCGGTVLPDGGLTPDGGGVVTNDGGTTVCALYGQACVQPTDCCAGVPCTNGTCHFP